MEQPNVPNIAEEIDKKLKQVVEANKTRDVLNIAPKKANWDLKLILLASTTCPC